MTTATEAPELIQYACERCKTRFVLPPSRRRLGFGGRLRATFMAIGRSVKNRQGLGSSFDESRRQILAKMDDDAYQSFVQSFRFCHECRQFVCNECWSNSRKTCLGCFARSTDGAAAVARPRPPFAPAGPEIPRPAVAAAPAKRRTRLRTSASLAVLAVAAVLLLIDAGFYFFVNAGGGPSANPTHAVIAVGTTATATATPTASPTLVPTPSATATATASPTASPSPSATPSPTPAATPSATPSPTPTPAATPTPTHAATATPLGALKATVTCTPSTGVPPVTVKCTWTGYTASATATWLLSSVAVGTGGSHTFNITSDANVQLKLTRKGSQTVYSSIFYYITP
jgi:cytoskeletal protein RodZ